MTAVLEKVRRLERYVQVTNGQVDEILESTLDKLLGRERQRLDGQLARLKSQAADFESRYGWPSEESYPRFECGELGDEMEGCLSCSNMSSWMLRNKPSGLNTRTTGKMLRVFSCDVGMRSIIIQNCRMPRIMFT